MSLCRWGCEDSQLYIYETDAGFECECCPLVDSTTDGATLPDVAALKAHLAKHDAAGHRYPDRLRAELEAIP